LRRLRLLPILTGVSRFQRLLVLGASGLVAVGLAVLAVSLGWIGGSSNADKTVTQPAIVPTAVTERTLAALRAPTGFLRGSCTLVLPSTPSTACFLRRRSIVPDPAVMSAIVAGFGAKLDSSLDRKLGRNAATPSICHPERVASIRAVTRPLLVPVFCIVAAAIGSQHLTIALHSVVVDDHGRLASSSRSRPHVGGGSQITVTDFGT
jgi:hypothetical protein